jgi:hypothetical protein
LFHCQNSGGNTAASILQDIDLQCFAQKLTDPRLAIIAKNRCLLHGGWHIFFAKILLSLSIQVNF